MTSRGSIEAADIGAGFAPRVLHVINSLTLAGAEVLVGEMAPRLRDHGCNVTVAVLRVLDSPLERRLATAGIPVVHVARAATYSPFHIWPLARLMQQYDIVHVHLFPAQLWAAGARRFCKRPPILVTTEHNPDNNRRHRPLARMIDRFVYAHYGSIICNSEATASALREWIPSLRERLTVIPNGIAVARFSAAAAAERGEILRDARGPVAMFVARLQPQKDHATLLRAVAEVPDLQLILVGEGELRADLEQLARSLSIADRVHFLGHRTDIAELLKMANVYVHATHSDGFGIAALEAMAAGLPIVASNVPGLAEVISDSGILVPPGEAQALAAAIRRVLGDSTLRSRLAAAAAARARSFDIARTVESHLELYERLLAARSAVTYARRRSETAAKTRGV